MRSMTGFGRSQREIDGVVAVCEARSLNHKGLDAKVRLPRDVAALEPQLLQRVKAVVERGRLDLSVELTGAVAEGVDGVWVARQVEHVRRLAEGLGIQGDLSAADILTVVLASQRREHPSLPTETAAAVVLAAAEEALQHLVESRAVEGAALARALEARIQRIDDLRGQLHVRTADAPRRLAGRLKGRLDAAMHERGEALALDPARVAQEVALLADRADVTEELERLAAHGELARTLLGAPSPGRKLEFLCQELLREANTLGSKCQDAPTAHLVVELKTEIERMREQVQNVE